MKNIKQYIFIIALLVGCIFLSYKWYQSHCQMVELKQARASVEAKVTTEAKEIARKVDEEGLETVLFEVTGNKVPTPGALPGSTIGIIDTTAMALDVRTKQLKQILVVKSTLEAENLALKKKLDASKRPYYTYTGNGLDLKFTPPNEADSIARAEFTANVNIKATQYWKRNWFLGSKKSILAVSSDNPMFKINGADYIEVEQKQPTFGLRVQANTAYNFDTGEMSYGPAVRFDVGRFSFQGRYSKFPNDPKWKPSINASYDILRF
jgi:hypothetical protein